MLEALEYTLRALRSGEYEITYYEWEQDFGSREVECGKIERFPLQKYRIKLSYRRKP